MADSAEVTALRTRIAEARAALHQVMLGDKAVQIDFGDNRRTRWNESKPADLRAYIAELELELSVLTGETLPRGPIYPVGVSR